MFPATCVTRPAFSNILPSSVTVVVLPLVPVTASTSPCNSDAARLQLADQGYAISLAVFTTGASIGTPGLMTTRSQVFQQRNWILREVKLARCFHKRIQRVSKGI